MSALAPRTSPGLPLLLVIACVLRTHAEDAAPKVDAKTALGWFNPVIGEWRGVGQVLRGSSTGAWRETGAFVWDFSAKEPAVRYDVADGKHLDTVRVTYDAPTARFTLAATLADESKRVYHGSLVQGQLVADSAVDDDGNVHRLVVTQLNEKRTLVRYERRRETAKVFTRVGEVGHTRAGTSLAVSGAGEPECVVTGGRGTMLVMHEGKSYYVCCTGCKQAFEDDPAGVIAEYEAKLAERRKAQ